VVSFVNCKVEELPLHLGDSGAHHHRRGRRFQPAWHSSLPAVRPSCWCPCPWGQGREGGG